MNRWKEKVKIPGAKWKQKHNTTKPLGNIKKSPKTDVYSIICLHKNESKTKLLHD